MSGSRVLIFESYRLDLSREQLRRGDDVIPLTNKAFAVLLYLVQHAEQLVTKEALLDAVWPDTFVSDAALTVCIRELRQALGDRAQNPQFIETVRGRGYRFLPSVTDVDALTDRPEEVSPEELDTVAEQPMVRRLAAIFSTDVQGYSRLMGEDEASTVQTLRAYREVFTSFIEQHRGRVVDNPGDNLLAEFASVVDAVQCAVAIQGELADRNAALPVSRQMWFRIGINLGDVLVDGDQIYGDGVNIAARVESLAEGGGICVSGTVYDQIATKLDFTYVDLGEPALKNIATPVRVYRVELPFIPAASEELQRLGQRAEPVLDTPITAPGPASRPPEAERRQLTVMLGGLALFLVLLVAVGLYFFSRPDKALEMPTGPVIAVLPFANLSGDPDQDYFADGISEEIITALTRFDEVFVLARNTTFQFKGQAVDVTRVGQDLGAHYVLEGSVQRAASRVRVTAQLLDAVAGTHLWAEVYERDLTTANIFDVMNDITSRVAGAIADAQGVITRAEGRRVHLAPPNDLAAYDCVLKTHAYWVVFTQELHAEVRTCLEGAVEREPSYAEAWAWLAILTIDEYRLGFNPKPNPRRRITAAAREAVRLAPDSEVAYQALAYSLFYDNDLEGFFVAAEKALELNPNNAQVVASLGLHYVYAGKAERGLALLQKAAALNPQHPGWYYFPSMYYYYGREEYERALAESKKLEQTEVFWAPAWIAAIYGQLGREVEARSAVSDLLRMNPAFPSTVREEYLKWFKWPPEQLNLFLEGLSKAGLEILPEKTGS